MMTLEAMIVAIKKLPMYNEFATLWFAYDGDEMSSTVDFERMLHLGTRLYGYVVRAASDTAIDNWSGGSLALTKAVNDAQFEAHRCMSEHMPALLAFTDMIENRRSA